MSIATLPKLKFNNMEIDTDYISKIVITKQIDFPDIIECTFLGDIELEISKQQTVFFNVNNKKYRLIEVINK